MSTIHFLNVLEGDCNIIQHDSGRVSVIDICNGNHDEKALNELLGKVDRLVVQKNRRYVPGTRNDYMQKKHPENPIEYLSAKLGLKNIHRFIITHPDMDHIDGIEALYSEFNISNTWDHNNKKTIAENQSFIGYKKADWDFYKKLRDGSQKIIKRLTYFDNIKPCQYWEEDNITVLAPSNDLLKQANETGEYNDASYVLLFTPPKRSGSKWKILFGGDSHNATWSHILENHFELVADIDVLIAPHHGRDSDMDFSFLEILNPKLTLMGNASSKHLAYYKYPSHITNNQAGTVILDISNESIAVYVKNEAFAKDYRANRNWGNPEYSEVFDAFMIGLFGA